MQMKMLVTSKCVVDYNVKVRVKTDGSGVVYRETVSEWSQYLRHQLGDRTHFWHFDGWEILHSRSAVVELYPALWKHAYAIEGRTGDQHDAFVMASWLHEADRDGRLVAALGPKLAPADRMVAMVEGWILGVG